MADQTLSLPAHVGLTQTRDGPMLFFSTDRYIGGSLARYGEYCHLEAELLQQLADAGDVVVEAGANIGAHTIGLARQVGPTGRVHAFEPQRMVHQMLCANVVLAGLGNVDTRNAGLGAAPAMLRLTEPDYMQTGNFGGVALAETGTDMVQVLTLDSLQLPRVDLIKIDVEGMEEQVLHGGSDTIARCRPILYVENDRDDRAQSLLRLMLDWNYQLWWHTPPLFNPDNLRGVAENEFRGLMALNVLGIPREREMEVGNLRPITSDTTSWRE